jgi:hypothetical protein
MSNIIERLADFAIKAHEKLEKQQSKHSETIAALNKTIKGIIADNEQMATDELLMEGKICNLEAQIQALINDHKNQVLKLTLQNKKDVRSLKGIIRDQDQYIKTNKDAWSKSRKKMDDYISNNIEMENLLYEMMDVYCREENVLKDDDIRDRVKRCIEEFPHKREKHLYRRIIK